MTNSSHTPPPGIRNEDGTPLSDDQIEDVAVARRILTSLAGSRAALDAMTELGERFGICSHRVLDAMDLVDVPESAPLDERAFDLCVACAAVAGEDEDEDDGGDDRAERLDKITDDLRAGRLVKVDNPDGNATLYDGPYAEKRKLS